MFCAEPEIQEKSFEKKKFEGMDSVQFCVCMCMCGLHYRYSELFCIRCTGHLLWRREDQISIGCTSG